MRRPAPVLVACLCACVPARESEPVHTPPSRPSAPESAPPSVSAVPVEAAPEPAIVPSAVLTSEVDVLEAEELARIRAARAPERDEMVRLTIEPTVKDRRVLSAMRAVPREQFVPEAWQRFAYADGPLDIGYDVTISQPAVVARMTELLQLEPGDRVLEVGTGSGYQAAVLDALGAEVWSIEIIEPLAHEAATRLARLGYARVHVRHGDGYAGWPEHAPFDAIIVTAAPPAVPEPLKQQLAVGGRLVLPVGRDWQDLVVVTRTERGFREEKVIPVRFVPMTGEAQNLDARAPR